MINRQGRGYNTAGNTHNPDAISATRRQIKHGSPSARCLATGSLAPGSNNQAAGTVSPSLRLTGGGTNTTKSDALPPRWGWMRQSLFVCEEGKRAAEHVEKLIPYQMRNMEPRHVARASGCVFAPPPPRWHIPAQSEDVIEQKVETSR